MDAGFGAEMGNIKLNPFEFVRNDVEDFLVAVQFVINLFENAPEF